GFVGWLMVASGLAGRTEVNPMWLAAHLAVAFFIMAFALWLALDAVDWPRTSGKLCVSRGLVLAVEIALFAPIMLGALLAGSHGGAAYADWPTIGGHLFPTSYDVLDPVENHATQHFNHRTLGYVVAGLALTITWITLRKGKGTPRTPAVVLGSV